MGVNISLYRGKSEGHPTWDCARYSGDREMFNILTICGAESMRIGDPLDFEWQHRPSNVAKFRDAMIEAHPENEERWREMADILEDSEWWIHFGY